MKLSLALAAGALAQVAAHCPNFCNLHGICTANDICVCHLKNDDTPAWTGPDCSERTCPTGIAWVSEMVEASGEHPVLTCSAKGNCNRETGVCDCYEGYEGIACERTVCPNNCSGNGFCYTQQQLVDDLAGSNIEYTQPWDAQKHVGCKCDPGYRGPDCSLRECPTGPDQMGGSGAAQGRDCSGRGICDYTSGLCKCFHGFFGTKCEQQTILY
ncbi:sexually induced protein 3 [Tribonema minus]|uniref:Sexually induced protein 3 n=1 Tax=Tribonema minus TaxID=303371 RepID=A0A835ZIV1_9STRA|nr:sexually induced protein 3 [Tribonema minus]